MILEDTDKLLKAEFGMRLGRERWEEVIRTGKDRAVLYGEWVEIAELLDDE